MGDKWFGGRTRNPWNPKQGSSGSSAGPAGDIRRMRRLRHRLGDAGLHLLALHPLRRHRPAPHLRLRSPHRRHGPELDHGQARPHLPLRRRLRRRARSHLRPRRQGPLRPLRRLQLERRLRLEDAAHRLPQEPASTPTSRRRSSPKNPPPPTKPPRKRRSANSASASRRLPRPPRLRPQIRTGRARQAPIHGRQPHPRRTAETALRRHGAAAHRRSRRGLRRPDHDRPRQAPDRAGSEDWPNIFRVARFYPAVEYIQAKRARTLAIQQVSALFEQADIIVTPTYSQQLVVTNLTGHPALHRAQRPARRRRARPTRRRHRRRRPHRRPRHARLRSPSSPGTIRMRSSAAFARAYQQATGFEKLHPKLPS